MDQKFIDLYDHYNCGVLDRRQFMAKLARFTGGTAAALALLPYLENSHARAEVVPESDARIRSTSITYPGAGGEVRAYLAEPKGEAKVPGVVIIHTIHGLNANIEDCTRRTVVEGFLALAPDALSPMGGFPGDEEKAMSMMEEQQARDNQTTVKNYLAAVKYLRTHPRSNGNVGVLGFCWGGGMANQVAVNSADLKAAVVYYGEAPKPEDVPKIKASMLVHCAGDDERWNAGIPRFESELKKASIDYKIYWYEGAKHGFHNDTSEAYHKEAAQLAWERTVAFLNEKLKT